MGKGENYNGFDTLALFNTFLGLVNMDKNTASQEHSKVLEGKLDMVLERLDRIEHNMGSTDVIEEGRREEDRCMM